MRNDVVFCFFLHQRRDECVYEKSVTSEEKNRKSSDVKMMSKRKLFI